MDLCYTQFHSSAHVYLSIIVLKIYLEDLRLCFKTLSKVKLKALSFKMLELWSGFMFKFITRSLIWVIYFYKTSVLGRQVVNYSENYVDIFHYNYYKNFSIVLWRQYK